MAEIDVELDFGTLTLQQLASSSKPHREAFLNDLPLFLHTFQGWIPSDYWALTLAEYDSLKQFLDNLMPGDADGAG